MKCCREQQAGFYQSVALTLWFCCLYERSTIMLVEMFSDMCCLEDNASRDCQTNTMARSVQSRLALRSLVARRRHVKKVGSFHFFMFSVSHENLYSS